MNTRQAFEAWDEAGGYADWRKFDALPKQEQLFECWQAAKATGPQWHDAPTVPGTWLCNLDMQAYHLPDPEIDLGGGNRWYGPIPDDGGKP